MSEDPAGLAALGWNAARAEALAALGRPELAARRVVADAGVAYRVAGGGEESIAVLPGRLRREPGERPVVGDWVAVRGGDRGDGGDLVIEALLPRATALSRRDPDQRSEQILVANVDRALLVSGLDQDFNVRRLERYLTLVRGAGVAAAVVLSKADLAEGGEAERRRAEVAEAAPTGVPVLAVSLLSEEGIAAVHALLAPGETAVLLGSSGVGKSTLLNGLLGRDAQRTQPVRVNDSRGRHTTTRRELFQLSGGALVIDTPGLRELEPWRAGAGLADAFPDIAEAAARCRFRDCSHDREPGCAVRDSVPPARLAAYHKLAAELAARSPRRRR